MQRSLPEEDDEEEIGAPEGDDGGIISDSASRIWSLPYATQSRQVDAAIQDALGLVKMYANCDETSEEWKHPDEIFQQLDAARNRITMAWDELNVAIKRHREAADSPSEGKVYQQDPEELRVAYVDMITDAFADVLEDLRKKDEPINVEILVDCLQSGLDILSNHSKFLNSETDFAWNDEDNDSGEEDEPILTPHERRRRQIGFQLENAAT